MQVKRKYCIEPSTIQLLRFPFSLFLMPVYWFALSQIKAIHSGHAILIFIILHGLVYPASNGYNSYMDRDISSIGGLKQPLAPTRQLYYVTIWMDTLSILLALFIHPYFAIGITIYILVSKAYSYRGIRLKKYPVTGYLAVVLIQGAFIFALVFFGANTDKTFQIPCLPIIIAALFIGGFYPLTQVYQHEADLEDGVKTISYLLGYRGTFIFCGMIYTIAFTLLAIYFSATAQLSSLYIFSLCLLPVLLQFILWFRKVRRDEAAANFSNTMRMIIVASAAVNLAFIIIFIQNHFE